MQEDGPAGQTEDTRQSQGSPTSGTPASGTPASGTPAAVQCPPEGLQNKLPARKWQPAGGYWAWLESTRFRDESALAEVGAEAVGVYVVLTCLVGPRPEAPQEGLATHQFLANLMYRMSPAGVGRALTVLEERGWIARQGEDPFRYRLLAAPDMDRPESRRELGEPPARIFRPGEFFWLDTRILDRKLTAAQIAVYALLCSRADAEQQVWYSQADLERHLGLGSKASGPILQTLQAHGLIQIHLRVGHGQSGFAANGYTLLALAADGVPPGE